MKLREIPTLVHVGRPPAPYGVRSLARCFSVEDLARLARRRLPAGAWGYLEGGGEGEYTLRRNRAAFDELELVPRVLLDVSHVDTATSVLGSPSPLPIVLSPVGAPRMFHHEGELAVARAAHHAGLPYAISTLGTAAVEDIAAQTSAPLWFQLYVWGDRGEAREALARARAAGFRALLLSVDTSVRSKRERELHAGLNLPTPDLRLRTFLDGALHPSWSWHFLTSEAISFPNVDRSGPVSRAKVEKMFDGTVTWEDLDWIRQAWDGPIALKGVLRADDVRRAADDGLDGVIVSNHGGRQLDHVPPTLEILPELVDAADGRLEVLMDSGVRRGSDIVAALAQGARAVLIGRAHLYGLAAAGEAGVRHAIDILADELRMTMALCGARRVADLDRRLIRTRGAAAHSTVAEIPAP
jgi:L-lactate dehydrogenase (cytochrome)